MLSERGFKTREAEPGRWPNDTGASPSGACLRARAIVEPDADAEADLDSPREANFLLPV